MPKTIAIACGGTGGHVFPGLAIGGELHKRGHRVLAMLSGQHVEEHAEGAEAFGIESLSVPSVRLPTCTLGLPWFGLRLLTCGWRARRLLRLSGCNAVLGMGSFAAAPVCLGAVLSRTPLFLHEGNAIIGRANRLFARHARALAISLPLAGGQGVRCRVVTTGLPVRRAIAEAHERRGQPTEDDFRRWGLSMARETLLVFGGSQGAEAINNAVPPALGELGVHRPLQVIHLTGVGHAEPVREAYRRLGVPAYVSEGERAMDALYLLADAVICRAGASTLAELALLGKRAILIPLPSAADDHQSANAAVFVASFPAAHIQQPDADPPRTAAALEPLLPPPPPTTPAPPPAFRPNPNAAAAVADLVEAHLGG